MDSNRESILLVNMGGVRRIRDIVPFLFRMFEDRNILFVAQPLRTVLALVFTFMRARAMLESRFSTPLFDITSAQAKLLEGMNGKEVRVGYVYSEPLFHRMVKGARTVAMYPFYSYATHGKILEHTRKVVPPFCIYQEYADMIVKRIIEALSSCPIKSVVLLSAHSIPLSTAVKRRDPYKEDLEVFRRLLSSLLGRSVFLSFQSRFGRIRWLLPSTGEVIKRLAGHYDGIVVVPISFIAENSETLREIDEEYRKLALEYGFKCFKRMRCLNDDVDFVEFLRRVVG